MLYHGLFGIHIAFTAKENVGHYSIFRNWMFFFQRVSAVSYTHLTLPTILRV
ncbi:hypothetical protein JMUB7523_26570 [Staphylococcus aureus]